MNMYAHLIYCSFSQVALTDRQLQIILEKSQTNNLQNEITGLLLYRNNILAKFLEGPEKQVLSCMQCIRKDQRHFGSSVVFVTNTVGRLFPN